MGNAISQFLNGVSSWQFQDDSSILFLLYQIQATHLATVTYPQINFTALQLVPAFPCSTGSTSDEF